MSALVSINGRITPPAEASVSVFDRGFLFGDGVYETGKSVARCFLFLEEHWARLRRSAEKLRIGVPWTDKELTEGLFCTARQFGKPSVYFRTIVTRGAVDHVGLDEAVHGRPTLVHIVQDLSENRGDSDKQGIRLLTSRVLRNSAAAQDPDIKSSNYLNSLLALQDVRSRGGEDAVLCDREGRVTEGTTFSIFALDAGGRLLTPSLEIGILDSITRRHVLAVAAGAFPVVEGFFPLAQFQTCPEVFVASSVRGIVAVREWDGRKYELPSARIVQLQALLAKAIDGYVARHPKF